MKKLLGIVVLGLLFYNTAQAESSLPSCKGTDSFKWTNCFGTEKKNIAYDLLYKDAYKTKKFYMKVNIEVENFMGKEL